uniref:Serum response factor n=31 Tax=Passeriformes TaxID=9126 RepID=A0A8C5TCC7_9PASS
MRRCGSVDSGGAGGGGPAGPAGIRRHHCRGARDRSERGAAGGPCPETAAASRSRGRDQQGWPGTSPFRGAAREPPAELRVGSRAAGAGPPGPGDVGVLGGPRTCDVPGKASPGAASSPRPELTGALGAPRCEPPPEHRVFGGTAALPCPAEGLERLAASATEGTNATSRPVRGTIRGSWCAYELSTLTGTQVLLLVASETGHVYTFATRKLQPMITSETGKALIQTCLNSPDSPPRSDPTTDQRMSATGFEETDLTYQVSESDSSGETKDALKPAFTVTNLPGTTSIQTAPTTSTSMQVSSGPSFPITNYLAPVSASISPNAVTSANGTVLKTTGASAVTSGGLMPIPTGFTLMSGGTMAQQVPVQAIQVHQAPQQTSPSSDSSTDLTQTSSSGTVTLPATIMTSSVPTTVGGHMMYPSPHAVMYAPTSGLADGGLAVLNAFPQAPSAMQVSHGQVQDQGGVPQVFLTAPSGTVQIPVSAVQLHQMAVIGQQSSSGSSLTELQVVNLDTSHSAKSD